MKLQDVHDNMVELSKRFEVLRAEVAELRALFGERETDEQIFPELRRLAQSLGGVTEKVESRNKSAAIRRNMTDTDARRVLNGDMREAGHKEAAEALGLTYAQVYSCRMVFTFKHVHRELERTGWRSSWARA